jgi:zinc transporter
MININDPSYVFGLTLDQKGGAGELEPGASNFHWIHVDYGFESAQLFLSSLGISERVVQSLVEPGTRPRTLVSGDGVLAFIRGINMNPGSDPEDMVSLRMWIQGDRLVTVRQRKMLSCQDVRSELLAGQGPDNVADLVVTLIAKIADRISDYVDDVERKIDLLEMQTQVDRNAVSRAEISTIRREIAGVRRYLAPQREALDSLYTHSLKSMPDGEAYRLREQMDRITRYLEDLDLMRERTLVLQEEWMNIAMEAQNARMYALSIIAAIFLPVTFVTGIFGMNVAGLPGVDNPTGFLWVAGSMVVMAVVVISFFKIKRWL